MGNDLTSRILRYMEDDSARYAIALEGDWGSGKTRYCEKELTDCLYVKGYDVLRVSLFGASSADEVYNRLAMTLVRLSTREDEGRASRFFKGLAALGGRVAASYGVQKLSDLGITLEASPQLLTGMLGRKQLLVLDDVERCDFRGVSSLSFFGLVNNLIEAQGCKVLFVTNSYSAIPSEIREKVIWKCYRFEPKPEDLVRNIILSKMDEATCLPEFEVSDALTKAAIAASCRNARAMIKVTGLLVEAASAKAISDKRIDAENRECALRDFAMYAFRAAMGDAPTEQYPEGNERHVQIERIHKRAEYNTYQQLWAIKAFFDPQSEIREGDVDECLKSYVESNYAGSPATMDLKRVLDTSIVMGRMEDDEVEALAARLSECLLGSVFDLALLNNAMQMNMTLKRWGFEKALSEEELLRRAKELVDGDVEEAYVKTHREFEVWHEEWVRSYSLLVELDSYIVDQFERLKAHRVKDAIELSDPNAGLILADEIQNGLLKGETIFLEFDPEFIAELYARGSADSQYAIHELILGFKKAYVFCTDARAKEWAQRLRESMSKVDSLSRMGKQRLKWILGNLEELLGQPLA